MTVNAEPTTNSTFRSRQEARLEREAVEGVPPRRKLGLNAGENAEQSFVITTVDDSGSVT